MGKMLDLGYDEVELWCKVVLASCECGVGLTYGAIIERADKVVEAYRERVGVCGEGKGGADERKA